MMSNIIVYVVLALYLVTIVLHCCNSDRWTFTGFITIMLMLAWIAEKISGVI